METTRTINKEKPAKPERAQPFEVGKRILKERYPSAVVAFVAGSFNRGEETASSDIDLIVIFPYVQNASRESFYFDGWPVEAFLHDPETLHYFFEEVDGKDGIPSLPNMVLEGQPIPAGHDLVFKLKFLAGQTLAKGPPKWDEETIHHQRYHIADLVDDIRTPRSQLEANAVIGTLHEVLGNFYFRANGMWSATGKHIPRRFQKMSPELYMVWKLAFEQAYSGNSEKLIKLAADITKPFGGLLFEGYQRQAPKAWKLALPSKQK